MKMKLNKRVAPTGIVITVALALIVTGRADSAVLKGSLVLPEPLPGSYADKQRSAYANQTGMMPDWASFGTKGYALTRPAPDSYYPAPFPRYARVYKPRAVIYQSRHFPQPYGPYMPESPANPTNTDVSWALRG